MMAPYAVGHLKIGLILNELGHTLAEGERFRLYLTNTLDFTKEDPNKFPGIFEQEISKESREALDVKENIPIMVVIGNPPYSVSSTNVIKEGSDFYSLYESYKEMVRKEERNIQPLSDDYVKFIAFAHWKVKQSGKGIVGMITNNSFLDGLIHRDMRKKLLDDFNEIYILNLHGSSKRQEDKPENIKKDKNVFDIQQGVSVTLAIKNPGVHKSVKYFDLWGDREGKYNFLNKYDFSSPPWKDITPIEPFFFLTVKDFSGSTQYELFTPLYKIFRKFTASVVTGKDEVLTDTNINNLKNRILFILNPSQNNNLLQGAYKLDNSAGNKILDNRKEINFNESKIQKYHYRPLDYKFIYYEPEFLERHRYYLASSLLRQNLAICASRLTANKNFTNVIVADCLPDYKLAESSRGSYFFPLYLYQNNSVQQILLDEGQEKLDLEGIQHTLRFSEDKSINFSQELLDTIDRNLISPDPNKRKISHEDIFYYIYACLYSNTYRQKYQEFLKIDFPRVPFTKDYNLFKELAKLGEQLVNLHLLKSSELSKPIAKFTGKGECYIEKREFHSDQKRVYINDSQYFEGIEPEVWNYYIGGYHILDKWLKGRKGRALSPDDIKHYCKIVTTLRKTIEIQREIDKLYPRVENSLIES